MIHNDRCQDPTCDTCKWEERALDQLARVVQIPLVEGSLAHTPLPELSQAVARSVWRELVDTPVATGEHSARDLLVWFFLANIGAELVGDYKPIPGVVVSITRGHLASFFQQNLDALQMANVHPADITG